MTCGAIDHGARLPQNIFEVGPARRPGIPESFPGIPAYPKLGRRTDVRESRKVFRESRRTQNSDEGQTSGNPPEWNSFFVSDGRTTVACAPKCRDHVCTQMPGSRARSGNLGKFSGFPCGFLRQKSTKNTYVDLYRKNVLKSKLQLSYKCKIGIY